MLASPHLVIPTSVIPAPLPSVSGLTPACHDGISRCPGCRRPERVGEYTEAVACHACEGRLLRDLQAEDTEPLPIRAVWSASPAYAGDVSIIEEPTPGTVTPTTWPPDDDEPPPEKEPTPVEPEPEADDDYSYAAPEGAWAELWSWLDQVRGGL